MFDLSRYGVSVPGYGAMGQGLRRNIGAYQGMQNDRQANDENNMPLSGAPETEGNHQWTAGDSLLSFGANGGGGKGFQKWSAALSGKKSL